MPIIASAAGRAPVPFQGRHLVSAYVQKSTAQPFFPNDRSVAMLCMPICIHAAVSDDMSSSILKHRYASTVPTYVTVSNYCLPALTLLDHIIIHCIRMGRFSRLHKLTHVCFLTYLSNILSSTLELAGGVQVSNPYASSTTARR
jgi:hypothetical protein